METCDESVQWAQRIRRSFVGKSALTTSSPRTVTQLLALVSRGEASAQNKLWSLIYDELHALAHQQLARERPGHIQPTSLVHEAYIRLVGQEDVQWANRRHFFAAAARAMRRIRIDDARHRHRLKRGGGRKRVPLDEVPAVFDDDPAEILSLDGALDRLEQINKRAVEVVSLRYFGGLTVEETSKALDVSPRTVESDWALARAWLHREVKRGDTSLGMKEKNNGH